MPLKLKAALLNAFLLPGIGQLILGRKLRGVACIVLVNIILLAALFIMLKASSPLIAAKIASAPQLSSTKVMAETISSLSGFGKAVLAAFFAVWGFALIDLIRD